MQRRIEMGSEREVACVYYKWEGECEKGREGTFRKDLGRLGEICIIRVQ